MLNIRGSEIGMVFQEPMTSLNPLHTIEKQLGESLSVHQGIRKNQAQGKILEWLDRVGIREPKKRLPSYPHQLSGGERQRVMLAMALINHPKILLADEPTTALDVTIQRQILELIAELQRELNMAVLFITHDLSIVREIADRIVIMKDGNIVEEGNKKSLFESPREEYTRELLGLEEHHPPVELPDTDETILDIKDLRVHYPRSRPLISNRIKYLKAVDGVSFNLKKGETVGLIGESGSGKSSLGRAVLKLESSFAGGAIMFLGNNIHNLNKKQIRPVRKDMQIIFQDPFGSLSPRLTVEEILDEGLELHTNLSDADRKSKIESVLEEVGLNPSDMKRYPHEFSGGQRQRISLARVIVLNPKLLVLDEPTSSLDRSVQFQVVALLKKLQVIHGLAYLFISHDLKLARSLCHRLLIMKDGLIIEEGETEKIIADPQNDYSRELLASAGLHSR